MLRKLHILICLGLFWASSSCKEPYFRWQYDNMNEALHEQESLEGPTFLKAHLKNGEVYLFDEHWQVDSANRIVSGWAIRYDFDRSEKGRDQYRLAVDSVAIFEVNKPLSADNGEAILVPLTIVNAGLTTLCLVNPKACFGSCPTFYLEGDQSLHQSRAEGFSNAIAPSLEYGDIDDLKIYDYREEQFQLIMKNEALESHLLRQIELYALPHQEGAQVFQTRSGKFYSVSKLRGPRNLLNPEDNLSEFKEADGQEYFSLADASNLASREELVFEFRASDLKDSLALVLDFRQSLMTTYFIYSALGYMGDQVAETFAQIERDKDLYETMDQGIKSELGELELYFWEEDEWKLAGSLYETGPIAINRQIIPLVRKERGVLKLKLRFNKGLWRIDRLALAKLERELEPIVLEVDQLTKNGTSAKAALEALQQKDTHLASLPGDVFSLNFSLPDTHKSYDLFLRSEGYYLEWMRDRWLSEKNLWKLRQMFRSPAAYLKDEAAAYKQYEQNMEETFWSSRIQSQNLSQQ